MIMNHSNHSFNEKTKDLAKGAGIIFLGIFLMYIIKFVYRIVVSRYLGPEGYGLLSLGDMVMNLGYMLALIGLDVGLMKHLAYYFEKKDLSRMKGSFWGTVIVSGILSAIIVTLLIIFSNQIAVGFFNNPKFAPILIIFSIAIPLSIFARIITQAMLTFQKQGYDVCARVIGRDFVNLILAIAIVTMGGSIIEISFVYLIALVFSVILGYFILEKKISPFFRTKVKAIFEYKERITFALPLFFSAVFINVMAWADTFFLGVFKSATEVGIYNVALPLASALGIFLASFSRVFYPIIAGLIAKEQQNVISPIYSSMSRWIFLLSFPTALLLIFFPKEIITIIFGAAYIDASLALIVLSLAYFTGVVVGPTTETLISFHKNKTIFWLNAFTVIGNIILNIVLIPTYGIIGAALATGISIGAKEAISFVIVKKMIKLKLDLKNNYLKSFTAALLSLAISALIFAPLQDYFTLPISFCITLVIYFGSYLALLLNFKAVNREDKLIIGALFKKLGIKRP